MGLKTSLLSLLVLHYIKYDYLGRTFYLLAVKHIKMGCEMFVNNNNNTWWSSI